LGNKPALTPRHQVQIGKQYWSRIINFDALAAEGMVPTENFRLFDFAGTAEAIWEALLKRGLRAHTPNGP